MHGIFAYHVDHAESHFGVLSSNMDVNVEIVNVGRGGVMVPQQYLPTQTSPPRMVLGCLGEDPG